MTFSEAALIEIIGALATAVLVSGFAALVLERYRQRNEARASLREIYTELLQTQRRSREASLALARAGGEKSNPQLAEIAVARRAEFLELYHGLNLDASRPLWEEVRRLRAILSCLLVKAKEADGSESERLAKLARKARQNVQREFRRSLGHRPLQKRKPLEEFDAKRRKLCEPDEPGDE